MIQRPLRSLVSSTHAALAVAILAVSAACVLSPGDAFAQASDAAAAAAPSGQTYAVKPGQSLNDVAGEITGSKDRDVRQKMARQLFDANPGSFAGHDINKLKLGAVLTLPATDGGGAAAASSVEAASAPAAQPEAAASAVVASESAMAAPASESQAASGVSPQPEAASEAAPVVASAPASGNAASPSPAPARVGPDPALYGAAVGVLIVLALVYKGLSGKKRRRQAAERAAATSANAPRTFATLEEAQADADARNQALEQQREREAQANDAALQRLDDAVTDAPATRAEAQASPPAVPATPDPVTPPAPQDAAFRPVAPAAHHAAFVPPLPEPAATDDARKPATDPHASETAAREALARDLRAREMQLRDAEARQAVEEEVHAQLARDAAAREINAHGAELRAAQAEAAERRAEEQREFDEDDAGRDDESSPAPRFPMPKFAQEAVQALGSLELGLPPRMELTLNLPSGPVTSHGVAPSEPARPVAAPPVAAATPIDPAPFTPQPVARPLPQPGDAAAMSSVVSEIEAGTAGAASVAGLGATQFPPLSMDFNAGLPKSQTEPLPALTIAQLASIARNKLELAGEYIELGDLPGARTLLQEVIASNDPATRQRAASLLSTLAPHA